MRQFSRVAEVRKGLTTRIFNVYDGMGTVEELSEEVDIMVDVLLGRVEPPVKAGILTMYEIADAYYARASEMSMKIQRAERNGKVTKSDPYYKFRTGELRTFIEIAKRAADLGSRRLTEAQTTMDQERTGRESR